MSTLEHLLNPRGIAVVGASEEAGRPGAQCVQALRERSYAGGIYPVNPKYQELNGLRCYASIKDWTLQLPCVEQLLSPLPMKERLLSTQPRVLLPIRHSALQLLEQKQQLATRSLML